MLIPRFVRLAGCLLLVASGQLFAQVMPVPRPDAAGRVGYADARGKFVIPARYAQALLFADGVARAQDEAGWWLLTPRGHLLTKKPYHAIGDFKNGTAVVSVRAYADGGKPALRYGAITVRGIEVIPPDYDYLTADLGNARFVVGSHTTDPPGQGQSEGELRVRFGVRDARGQWLVPLRYEAIREADFRTFAARLPGGRWQAFDAIGQEIFAGNYTDIKDFDGQYATVRKDYRWGILDRSGRVVKPLVFREVTRVAPLTYRLLPMPQFKVVDAEGKTRFSYEFENLDALNARLYSYQLEGRRGLLSEQGQLITPPVFAQIHPMVGGLAVVQLGNRFGVIDQDGRTVLPEAYDEIALDSARGLVLTRNASRWGAYDRTGQQRLPLRFDALRPQADGSWVVREGNAWGTVDAAGNPLVASQYQSLGDFARGLSVATLRDSAGVVDARGTWLLDPHYARLHLLDDSLVIANGASGGLPFAQLLNVRTRAVRLAADSIGRLESGLLLVKSAGLYGLYHLRRGPVLPATYDYVAAFGSDSLLVVGTAGRRGLVNVQGRIVLVPSAQFQDLQPMREERAGARINGRWGFIDERGRLRLANRYEAVQPFVNGLAGVKINGRWGFIDKTDNLRVQPLYDEVTPFARGVALARKGKLWGFVDGNGREVLRPQYDSLQTLPSDRRLITRNGKKGLLDPRGKELFTPKYDDLRDLNNGLVVLGLRGKFGLYTLANFDVVPILYDEITHNPRNGLYTLTTRFDWQLFTVGK